MAMTCVCLRRSHREARKELDSCLEITKLTRGAESHRGGVWCPVTQPAQGEASSWDQLRFSSSFSSRCSMPPSLFLSPLFLDRSTYGPFPPCRVTSYSGLFPEWLRHALGISGFIRQPLTARLICFASCVVRTGKSRL